MTSTREEIQLRQYVADLAQLHDRYRDTEALRQLYAATCEALLDLSRAVSPEEAARRVVEHGRALVGADGVALYRVQKGRSQLLRRDPLDAGLPFSLSLAPGVLGDLERPDAGGCWAGDGVRAYPVRGRRNLVGILALQLQSELTAAREHVVRYLAAFAGAVLEALLVERRREDSRLLERPLRGAAVGDSDQLLGESPSMRRVLGLIAKLSQVDSSVLLRGETGTGKTLVARELHRLSARATGPFITLNCAALPEALVESELFGHEQGAFTGALREHKGRIEQAQDGTLFLDEVGDLPLAVQAKLLSFIEDRRYTRVGGERERSANVRIVSATHQDLERAAAEGQFRQDLLYRLDVFRLELPPLRERGADVLTLAEAIGHEIAQHYELPRPRLSEPTQQRLRDYAWPGNVRELRNVMEKALILSEDGVIDPALIPGNQPSARTGPPPVESAPYDFQAQSFTEAKRELVERWERDYFQHLIDQTDGNLTQGAKLARMDKKTLRDKLVSYGLRTRRRKAARERSP